MDINLVEVWGHMSNLVRAIVIVLSLQGLASIAVVVDRMLMLLSGYRRSRKFAKEAGPVLAAGHYDQVVALSTEKRFRGAHLGELIASGLKTFRDRRGEGHGHGKSVELAKRALERKAESVSEGLHRGLNVLASTGSTAPFVGLLGTVLGILNAFRLIGQEGSGGIGTIGVAIAEALIVTGFGLMVAIPAVLLFNWINGRIAKYEGVLANASSELVDRLDGSRAEPEVSSSGFEDAPSDEHDLVGAASAA